VRSRGWYWPVGLAALLVVSAGANIALIVITSRDASFAVEPNYYAKALAWDETMAQQARNEALGGSVTVPPLAEQVSVPLAIEQLTLPVPPGGVAPFVTVTLP